MGYPSKQFFVVLSLSRSIWARQIGATRLSSAPKVTDVYRIPSVSTLESVTTPTAGGISTMP